MSDKEFERDQIKENGEILLKENKQKHTIETLTIIGEIEGHDMLGANTKATKYEHILPLLAKLEDDSKIDGLLLLLNTMGGDVEAGLAIAEMIASLSKPTVSLVLGGSHSIGIPIAVSTNYSFIVPTATMVVHPVRLSGTVIGVAQTFDYFTHMQNRITGFISEHSHIKEQRLKELMMETEMLTKDIGTVLAGKDAVKEGIIDDIGGIDLALKKLHKLIEKKQKQ